MHNKLGCAQGQLQSHTMSHTKKPVRFFLLIEATQKCRNYFTMRKTIFPRGPFFPIKLFPFVEKEIIVNMIKLFSCISTYCFHFLESPERLGAFQLDIHDLHKNRRDMGLFFKPNTKGHMVTHDPTWSVLRVFYVCFYPPRPYQTNILTQEYLLLRKI